MTPLTESEIDYAKRLAAIRPKFVGKMSSGEVIYVNGRYLIEKDHTYLVEPTSDELAEIYRIIRRNEPDDLAPARGIMVGMLVGSALWLVIGLVIYFTFFN